MAASEQAVEVGEILVDKYRVEREVGRGGMGVVVEATHLKLDERVAIKLLHPELATQPNTVKRFTREARAASKIKSPHVARVLDVDTLPSGAPYMVLELLEGFTLSQLSRAAGPLDPATTAAYIVQACDAIAEAHELGIVHRDLKPSNLFLCQDRNGAVCLKVLDFGISKVGAAIGGEEITNTDQLLGSPTYMSPEQLRSSRKVDGRTDIWSLGVVLYQCLTRSSPFQADTMPQVLMRVLSDDPEPPRSLRADLPEGLEQVILRCMDKDPERRFATAQELAEALTPFALAGPVPWTDVSLADKLPAASARSAVQMLDVGEPSEDQSDEETSRPDAGVVSGSKVVAGTAATQDTQVGWGTTLGSAGSRSRKKWIVAGAAGLLVVALVVVGAMRGLSGADGGEEPQSSSDPAAAMSDQPPSPVPSSADPPADTAASEADDGPSASASAQTSAPETPAPPATAAQPAPKPTTNRPRGGTRPRGKVDPFGRSRQ